MQNQRVKLRPLNLPEFNNRAIRQTLCLFKDLDACTMPRLLSRAQHFLEDELMVKEAAGCLHGDVHRFFRKTGRSTDNLEAAKSDLLSWTSDRFKEGDVMRCRGLINRLTRVRQYGSPLADYLRWFLRIARTPPRHMQGLVLVCLLIGLDEGRFRDLILFDCQFHMPSYEMTLETLQALAIVEFAEIKRRTESSDKPQQVCVDAWKPEKISVARRIMRRLSTWIRHLLGRGRSDLDATDEPRLGRGASLDTDRQSVSQQSSSKSVASSSTACVSCAEHRRGSSS